MPGRSDWLALTLAGTMCASAGCGAARSSAVPRQMGSAGTGLATPSIVAVAAGGPSAVRHLTRIRDASEGGSAATLRTATVSVESTDPGLRAALARLAAHPAAAQHRDVALAYRAVGIDDRAFDHYQAAIRLDPADASAHDGLARIWRDWGLPVLALTESHRAIFHAPASAAARNTLGTVLQTLGQVDAARSAYGAALRLDAGAAYALNNLCALELSAGRLDAAAEACHRVLVLDPASVAGRHNLAALDAARADAGTGIAAAPPGTPPAAALPPGS